jgi:hypothetical protein
MLILRPTAMYLSTIMHRKVSRASAETPSK